jgi:hypothetical protein
MKLSVGRHLFMVVAIVVLLGTAFRVATAPERVKKLHETARSNCGVNGGTWKVVDGQELCEKP